MYKYKVQGSKLVNLYHFFRDLLYHFGQFINHNLGNIFRKIELNIQTRTFQYTKFSQELNLPALYLEISSFFPVNQVNNPLFLNQNLGFNPITSSYILYNETINEAVILHQIFTHIYINTTINASTPIEALELAQLLNQIFFPNTYFEWDDGFTTFVPIPESLISNWDILTHDIYYLYESKLTSKMEDKIINSTIYYGLLEVKPIIRPNQVNVLPNSQTTTQTITLPFEFYIYLPTIMYNISKPSEIRKINLFVLTQDVYTVPILEFSYNMLTNKYSHGNYKFYKGYVISKTNLSHDNSQDIFSLTLNNVNITGFDKDKNPFFIIQIPDNNEIINVSNVIDNIEYNDTAKTLTITINGKKLNKMQYQYFKNIINNNNSGVVTLYSLT